MPTTFLDLPPEIRTQIYQILLVSVHQPLWLQTRTIDPKVSAYSRLPFSNQPDLRHGQIIFPSILRTCKLIHSEAAPILYSKNTFFASSFLSDALASFGPRNASYITHLSIMFPAFDQELWSKTGEIRLQEDGVKAIEHIATKCGRSVDGEITSIQLNTVSTRVSLWIFLQGGGDSEEYNQLVLFGKVKDLLVRLFPDVERLITPEMDGYQEWNEYYAKLERGGWTVRLERKY